MAFNLYTLTLVKEWARQRQRPRIACLGYPDMLVPKLQLQQFLELPDHRSIPVRDDGPGVLQWHGRLNDARYLGVVVETDWVLRQLGLEPVYIDINRVRGGEVIQDLNEPLAPDLVGQFDIVYDAGTMEHCFNVGQAVKNILALAKVGGMIYHGNPHNAGNHGFYNFCPTFYHDFYTQNGHDLAAPGCSLLIDGNPVGALPIVKRYPLTIEREGWIMAVIRKVHDKPPMWPTQTKYITNPTLGGTQLH